MARLACLGPSSCVLPSGPRQNKLVLATDHREPTSIDCSDSTLRLLSVVVALEFPLYSALDIYDLFQGVVLCKHSDFKL